MTSPISYTFCVAMKRMNMKEAEIERSAIEDQNDEDVKDKKRRF